MTPNGKKKPVWSPAAVLEGLRHFGQLHEERQGTEDERHEHHAAAHGEEVHHGVVEDVALGEEELLLRATEERLGSTGGGFHGAQEM